MLRVNEIYSTICGEGQEIGRPAIFIRLQGCNLRCPGWPCDTPNAIPIINNKHDLGYMTISALVGLYRDARQDLLKSVTWRDKKKAVSCSETEALGTLFITGGEPLMQQIGLLEFLKTIRQYYRNLYVILQTNGTKYHQAIFEEVDLISCDIKTPSSLEEPNSQAVRKLVAFSTKSCCRKVQFKFAIAIDKRIQEDLKYAQEWVSKVMEWWSPTKCVLPGDCLTFCFHPVSHVVSPTSEEVSYAYRTLCTSIPARLFMNPHIRILPQLHRVGAWDKDRVIPA